MLRSICADGSLTSNEFAMAPCSGGYYGGHVAQDLAAGRLEQADIDRALNRTITQMITLGLADEEVPAEWAGLGEADIDDVEKRRLAKHAAMQGRETARLQAALSATPERLLGCVQDLYC